MENEKVAAEKKRKKRKGKSGRIVIVLIVVLAALLGGFFLYKKKTSSQKSQGDQSVSTATVKRTDISSELTASSSLSPKDTYEVTSLVEGEVIEAGKPVTMVNLDSDAIERTVTIVPTRVKQLLVPHILNGELAIELPSIAEKKAYIVKQLTEETWESELRIEMPHKHYVNMTPAVAECRSKMYAELHGGKV